MKVDIEKVAQDVASGILQQGVTFVTQDAVRRYATEYGWDAEIDEFGPDGIDKRSDAEDDAINKRIAEIIADGIPKGRSRRKIAYASEATGETLTATQVDFLRELSRISGWKPAEFTIIEHMVDMIGGNFMEKPTKVGAILSTLSEKGIIRVALKKEGKRNMKAFVFTDKGVTIYKEIMK